MSSVVYNSLTTLQKQIAVKVISADYASQFNAIAQFGPAINTTTNFTCQQETDSSGVVTGIRFTTSTAYTFPDERAFVALCDANKIENTTTRDNRRTQDLKETRPTTTLIQLVMLQQLHPEIRDLSEALAYLQPLLEEAMQNSVNREILGMPAL